MLSCPGHQHPLLYMKAKVVLGHVPGEHVNADGSLALQQILDMHPAREDLEARAYEKPS